MSCLWNEAQDIRRHKQKSTKSRKSSLSLPGIFEDHDSGYPLRVSKVILKWTGPIKILPKGYLESNLVQGHLVTANAKTETTVLTMARSSQTSEDRLYISLVLPSRPARCAALHLPHLCLRGLGNTGT